MVTLKNRQTDEICQPDNHPKTVIAAFDFDGTISTHDSLIELIRFIKGDLKFILNLLPEIPFFIAYLLGFYSRQQIKERVLTRFFKGLPYSSFKTSAEVFAKDKLNKIIRPEALKRIKWHLDQNHRLILISANLESYLEPWAKAHGFEKAICSKIALDDDLITGKLQGTNCWGPEKTARLLEYLGPKENFILYAYGDSRGDKELLALSDFPFYAKKKSVSGFSAEGL